MRKNSWALVGLAMSALLCCTGFGYGLLCFAKGPAHSAVLRCAKKIPHIDTFYDPRVRRRLLQRDSFYDSGCGDVVYHDSGLLSW